MADHGPQPDEMNPFRPPAIRAVAGVLDRSLFSKTVSLAAASIQSNKLISDYRRRLQQTKELLLVDRISPIVPHPDQALASEGRKCLLLDPSVKATAPDTWSSALQEGVKQEHLGLLPYELKLDYNYWTYDDVIRCILPPELHDEIPSGFNTAGHVAHLNLREPYYPYKKVIAEVIMEKNPHIRTVINKVDNVGTESEFRTFAYETLAGLDDLNVEVAENNCVFRFDYAKVYWNSKLETEHTRLINSFRPGEVVCDVMAGIGPFAVPAGKKGVFVWANDMNPESYKCLEDAVQRNKVQQYVRPFNEDGRVFIKQAADSVLAASRNGEHAVINPKVSRHRSHTPGGAENPRPEPRRIPIPPTISHFVMNLPASATTFVRHYRGLYAGQEELFTPHTETQLPLIHVHCFAVKLDDDTPLNDICERLSAELNVKMVPGDADVANQVSIHDVRDVAPKKRMFCASFRLPAEVAFAPREGS